MSDQQPSTSSAPADNTNNNNNNNTAPADSVASPSPQGQPAQIQMSPTTQQSPTTKDDGAPLDYGPSMNINQFQSPTSAGPQPNNNSNNNSMAKQQTPQQGNTPSQKNLAAPSNNNNNHTDESGAASASTNNNANSRKAPKKIHPAEEPPVPARPIPIPEKDIPPRLRGLYGKAELLFYSVVIRRTASGLFNKNKPGLVFLTPSALFILDMSFMVTRYVPVGEIASPCGVYEQTKQVLLKPINDVEILVSFPSPDSSDLDDNAAAMARACGNRGLAQFVRCLYAAHFFAHRPADVPAACNPPLRLTKMPPDVMLKSLSRSARSSPSSSDRQAKIEMRLKNEMNKKEGITRPHAAQASADDVNNKQGENGANGPNAARDEEGAGAQSNFTPDMKIKQLAEQYVEDDEAKRKAAAAAQQENEDGLVVGPNGERVPPVVAMAQKYASNDPNRPSARPSGSEFDEEEEFEEEEEYEEESEHTRGSSRRSRGSSRASSSVPKDPNFYFKPEGDLVEYFDAQKQQLRVSGRRDTPRLAPPALQKPPQDAFAMMAFFYACGIRVLDVRHNYDQTHPLERVPRGDPLLLTVSTQGTAIFWIMPRAENSIWQFNAKEDLMMVRFEKNGEVTMQIKGAQGAAPMWIRLSILINNLRPPGSRYVEAEFQKFKEDEDALQSMLNILARGLLFCHPLLPCDYIRPPPPPPKKERSFPVAAPQKENSVGGDRSTSKNSHDNVAPPHGTGHALGELANQYQPPNQMSASNFAATPQSPQTNLGQQQSQSFLSAGASPINAASTPVGQQYARTGALPRVKAPGNRESLSMMALCYASFVRVADFSLPEHLARTPSGAPHPIMPYLLQSVLFTINPTGNAIFWRPMVEAPLWSFNALHDVEAIHFRRGGLISILVRPYGGRSQPCKMTIQPMLYRPNIGGPQDPDELKTVEADITIPAEREELIRSAKSLLEVLHALAPNVQFTVDRPDSSSRTTSIATSARDGSHAGGGGNSSHRTRDSEYTGTDRSPSQQTASSQHTGSDRAHALGPAYRPRGPNDDSRSQSRYTDDETGSHYTNGDHRSHSESDTYNSRPSQQHTRDSESLPTPRGGGANPRDSKTREFKNPTDVNGQLSKQQSGSGGGYPMDAHKPIDDHDADDHGAGDDWDHERGAPKRRDSRDINNRNKNRSGSRGGVDDRSDSRYSDHHRDRRHHGDRDHRRSPGRHSSSRHRGRGGGHYDDYSDYSSEYSRGDSRGRPPPHRNDTAIAAVLRDVPLSRAGAVQPIQKDGDVPVDAVKIMSEVDWRSIIQQDPVTAATVMADAQQQWEMERAAIAHELLRMHEERSLLLGQNDALQHQVSEILEGRGNVVTDVQKLSQQCFQLQQQLQAERKIRQQAIDDNVYKTERFFEGVIISQQDEVDVLKERLRRLEGVLERVGDAAGSAPKFKYGKNYQQNQQQNPDSLPPPNMTIGSDGPFSPSAIGYYQQHQQQQTPNNSNQSNKLSVQYEPGTTSGPLANNNNNTSATSPLGGNHQFSSPSSAVSPPRSAAQLDRQQPNSAFSKSNQQQHHQDPNNSNNNNNFFSPNSLQFPPHQQQQQTPNSYSNAPPNSPYYGGPTPPRPQGSSYLASPYATPSSRAGVLNRNSPGSADQSLRYSLMMDT